MNAPTMFFWLLVGHALADYPLQGDFLATGKNRHFTFNAAAPWWLLLTMHALIHAGAVALVTQSPSLGVGEFIAHACIDGAKCDEVFGEFGKRAFTIDQALHIVCKLVWILLATQVLR